MVLYTRIKDMQWRAQLFSLAFGNYQFRLLCGQESWDGATLENLKRYQSLKHLYAETRANLRKRIEQSGIPHEWIIEGNHEILIVG